MKKFIRTFALIAALIAVMAVSTTALAAQPGDDPAAVQAMVQTIRDAADPDAAFLALTDEQRAAVREAVSVQSVEVVTEVSSTDDLLMANGCATHIKSALGKGSWGELLWKFTSSTWWCWDGTYITVVPHFTVSGYVYYPHWTYHGTHYKTTTGGLGWKYHRDSTQGEFRYCEPPDPLDEPQIWVCTDYQYPVLHKVQYGDGGTG